MQGFLWLLLQMALLLLAAAVVFFWLGWHWRGQNFTSRLAELNARIDAESRTTETARKDREAAQAVADQLKSNQLRESADLQEARDRQRSLEREILRLSDALKSATAQPAAPKTEAADATPAPADSKAETLPSLEGSPFKKSTATADKAAKIVNGRNILKRLEKSLATQSALAETLRAECVDWQIRVDAAKTHKDRVGLRVATKNLERYTRQLNEAIASVESRQRQIRAIAHSLETSTKGAEDDLTLIPGIKTTINDQLRSLGIRTHRQIALWSDEEALAFGELLAVKKNATRDIWRSKARELHISQHGSEPS